MTRNAMNITAMSGRSVATIPVGASAARACDSTALVLLITDLLHPVHGLAVELFLNGDVRHRRGRGRAMPVLLVRWEPHHVSRPDLLDRAAVALGKAEAGCDDQRLPERMGVPRRARAGFERDR